MQILAIKTSPMVHVQMYVTVHDTVYMYNTVLCAIWCTFQCVGKTHNLHNNSLVVSSYMYMYSTVHVKLTPTMYFVYTCT